MINLFVTYRCNLACPYCFATDLKKEFPEDLTPDRFDRLYQWMARARIPAAAFIGGEPTLHPDIRQMVRRTHEAGIAVVLFTNGQCGRQLVDALAPFLANVVVNYNDPAFLTHQQNTRLHETLARFRDLGVRLTFSKNFTANAIDYRYVISGLDRYGVKTVRYDIARPGPNGENDHCALNETRHLFSHVVDFVRECHRRNISTGLDCAVRLCDMTPVDRRFLEKVSIKFNGICHPSIDIHPDLSASYCLPMRHVSVPDVTRFSGPDSLIHHFARHVRPFRFLNVPETCVDCGDYLKRCQGGCLALKKNAAT